MNDAERIDAIAVGRMFHMLNGFGTTQAVSVAARLGIADLIVESPKNADELAIATKTHGPSLRRLLRFLAGHKIFEEDANGRYRNTPASNVLRSDHPGSVRAVAIMQGAPFIWRPWGELYEVIVTGEPSFDRIYGDSFFSHLASDAGDNATFDAAMTVGALGGLTVIPRAYDFSRFERIVDVGGGQGALLDGILRENPRLRGVLVDLPAVVAGASGLSTGPARDRCEIVAADFFVSLPRGADAYLIKSVLHNWSDEYAVKILKNCRQAIRPDGTLLVVERILKPPNEPDDSAFMDLNMMLVHGGRERTETDFGALLHDAGFSMTRVIAIPAAWSIIEAKPA